MTPQTVTATTSAPRTAPLSQTRDRRGPRTFQHHSDASSIAGLSGSLCIWRD